MTLSVVAGAGAATGGGAAAKLAPGHKSAAAAAMAANLYSISNLSPIECTRRAPRDNTSNALRVKRLWALAALLVLAGCRDVRIQTLRQGETTVLGGNELVVVRDTPSL